jgi:hypothetical protein
MKPLNRKAISMNRISHAVFVGSAVALSGLALVACGGSSGAAKSTGSASAAPSAASSASGGARGAGGDLRTLYNDPQVQACLKAAGITVPTFSARPSGARPSGAPTGERPTNFPSGARPSGSGFAGGQANGQFAKIEAALKACGIAVPTFTPRSGGAAPTASPSS